ncbi:MAG: hypothetical protein IJ978_01610, partial [Clostridia bacterium]|nr:hypothetical protein [Clostridia bacterium]
MDRVKIPTVGNAQASPTAPTADIGRLLLARGYKITIQKFDPYINIDPGTLNPYEHGECYVT